MLSDRVSLLKRMHCCTVHTLCYAIKHLKEYLIIMLLHLMVQTLPGGWTVQSIQQPVPSADKRGGLASGRASGHKTFAIKSKCRDSQRIRVGLGRTP